MRVGWKLGRVAGIDVFVHWTFLILIGWIILAHLMQGESYTVAAEGVLFVLAIFACVVLHELGHALMARKFHVRTRDIVLLPIGGVARLERIPENPRQEFWVAIAGPAVTLGLAFGLFAVVTLLAGLTPLSDLALVGGHFLTKLMWVNVALFVFNLIPAFPMDGGRVLRSFLAQRIDYARATRIAARIGQGLAILFGFLGFFTNPFLLFIALFVYLGAQSEAQAAEMRGKFTGFIVRDAMMTHFRSFREDDTLGTAVDELLASDQEDFPITEQDRVVGLLLRRDLMRGLAQEGRDARIGKVMQRDCASVADSDSLERTFMRMQETACPALPVTRAGVLVGLISRENILEWVMVQAALHERIVPGRGEAASLAGTE